MDYAKRLGLTRGKVVVLDRTEDMTLAVDLAIYLAKPGRSHPLDRYAGAAQFRPGSDEATVLEAMRHARFSIWRVERLHEIAGLVQTIGSGDPITERSWPGSESFLQ
jgi:hypothetical protein